ncbi:MAG: flagellar basal body L-ring protein FlgH [Gammaproteobacteria bacterium]|nr:flagellar basal body L-ring protein FlgH [Gammaproteobacteria bacterium]
MKILLLALILLSSACSHIRPTEKADFAPVVRPDVLSQHVYQGGSLYQPSNMLLFEDPRPHKVGDLLTVVLQESTNASKKASTATSKSESNTLASPTLLGRLVTDGGTEILNTDIAQDRDFSGEGDSSQSNSLTGNITVTVVDVLSNNNLVVQGEKWLTLNQGDEYVRIKGVIRPQDVRADNTVLSTRIADAQIAYSGEGFVQDSNEQGWLAQFFNSKWWPF